MATKRGKLSRIETYFIDGNRSKMDAQQLADALNRGLKIVKAYLTENPLPGPEVTGSIAGSNIPREKGTAIMTEAASMAADETRSRALPASHERCTSKIYKD
jgi:hypothetical protein